MARRSIATVRRPVTHLYRPDPDAPADHSGRQPCRCGLPERNSVHHPPTELADAQAAHRERAGDREEEQR